MLTIVIDTNVLLQCPPLEQLDWVSFDPDGVHVIIPLAVVGEIDAAKSSGTSRRAKKARAVASMIGAALDSECNGGTLGQKKGSWELGSGIVATDERLDLNIPDQRIIAEALQISHDTVNMVYLTGDNLARVRAKSVGLRVLPLPDTWLLAPEPDERDKRMRNMEQQLAALTKQSPRVVLGVMQDGHPIERLSAQFHYLRDPNKQELDTLVALVERTYPAAEGILEEAMNPVRQAMGYRREVPSATDFQIYRHSEYPAWLGRVRKQLSKLPGSWSLKARLTRLTIIVRNDGVTPADGFRFEYEVVGSSAQLLPQAALTEPFPSLSLPEPPKPPQVRYTNPMDKLAMIDPHLHRFEIRKKEGCIFWEHYFRRLPSPLHRTPTASR